MAQIQTGPESQELIDPDPFTVASLFIGATALVLQFLQTAKAYEGAPPKQRTEQSKTHLARLEDTLEDVQKELRDIVRVIERGAADPDREFYDVGFRLSLGIMKFDAKWHGEFTDKLASSYGRVSALARWVNAIIGSNPALAVQIGREIQAELADAPNNINKLIADGAPNRTILFETRRVLDVLQRTVTALLDDRSN